jgi:hypothetical protein
LKSPKIFLLSSTVWISGLLDDAALAQVRFRRGGEDRSGKVGPMLRFIKKFCRKFLHFLLITLLVDEKQDRIIHFYEKTQIFSPKICENCQKYWSEHWLLVFHSRWEMFRLTVT